MVKTPAKTGAFITFFSLMGAYALPAEVLDKPFNEVTFIMTHNSASRRTDETTFGNIMRKIVSPLDNFATRSVYKKAMDAIQRITITNPNIVADQQQTIEKQLADGVRAFKIPVHLRDVDNNVDNQDTLWSCHTLSEGQVEDIISDAETKLKGVIPTWVPGGKKIREALLSPIYVVRKDRCALDTTNVPLAAVFKTLSQWLDKNPQEVIGMYMDVSLTGEQKKQYKETVAKLLKESGLEAKRYVHKPGNQWPTIREMLNSNKRFFLYTDHVAWTSIGIFSDSDMGAGTAYNYKTVEELIANSRKPFIKWGKAEKDRFLIIDNYTTGAVSGKVLDAKKANEYNTLKKRILSYEKLTKQPVTFVMVDFYDEPANDAVRVANDLNKIPTAQRIETAINATANEQALIIKQLKATKMCRGCDLQQANLAGENLSGTQLQKANLSEANLKKTNISGAWLQETVFEGADLTEADLSRADMAKANMKNAILQNATLTAANMPGTDFSQANLEKANLSKVNNANGAKFKKAILSEANLQSSPLVGADFSEANLSKANLMAAGLQSSNLTKANLQEADLRKADLNKATTTDANFTKADLRGANLPSTDLSKAILTDVKCGEFETRTTKLPAGYTCTNGIIKKS